MGASSIILLAEDQAMLRNLIRTILQHEKYDVLVAADGREALELSRVHVDPIDLLLTDVEMPDVDGISLYRQISSERSNTQVLFMSGSGQIALPEGLPFLRKPFEPDTLLAKINEILQGCPVQDFKVILVVDHDENRRERTRNILIQNNYAVLTASSVEDAKVLSDSIAKIDLIVTGVVFPGQSGIVLAEHVDASKRNISTLMISHFHPDLLHKMTGFTLQPEFLSNPFTPEVLLSRIRRLLE
jgi:DNA-binding response OmpR family regulator